MKTPLKLAAIFMTLAILSGIAWAATTFTYTQTLTVPPDSAIKIYKADGITLLADGVDLTTQWLWNSANKQFSLTLVIKNTGTSIVTTAITSSDIPSGWTLATTGTGSLNPAASQTVTVTLTNPSAVAGDLPTFHITAQGA